MIYNPAAPTLYGHKFNRVKPEEVLHVPEGTDALNTTDESAQIRVIGGQLKLYYGGEWVTIGGGSTLNVRDGVKYDSEGYLVWGGEIDVDVTLKLNGGKSLFIESLVAAENSNILYYDNETGQITYGAAPTGGGGGTDISIYTHNGSLTSNRFLDIAGYLLEFDWYGNGTNTLTLNASGADCTYQLSLITGANEVHFTIYPNVYNFLTTNGTATSVFGMVGNSVSINCTNGTTSSNIYIDKDGEIIFTGQRASFSTPGTLTIASSDIVVTGMSSGAGYVLTDLVGDGTLTLQPGGGGGGVVTGVKSYYVSTSGSDANDGLSPATAWQSIGKVNSFDFVGGDNVLFEGGKTFTDTPLYCKGGTAGNRIVYGSYGGGRAILQGNNINAVDISDVSYLTVRDLIIQGINHPEAPYGFDGLSINAGYGVVGTTSAVTDISLINLKIDAYGWNGIGTYCQGALATQTNILIEGCEISNCGNGIVFLVAETGTTNTYTNVTIRNCKVYNNLGIFAYADNWSGSGIVLMGCINSLIEECESYNNGWRNGDGSNGPHGIWISDCVNTIIRNCESHHNGTGASGRRVDGGGFDIDGGCQNCIIEYCYSHDNSGCGYAMLEYGSVRPAYTGNIIRYCISVADARLSSMGAFSIWTTESGFTNNRIHNNLVIIDSNKVVAGTTTAMEFLGGSYGTFNIFNNIFIVDGASASLATGTVGGTWANNITYATNGANLNYSTGCTVANPMLVNHIMEAPTVGAYAQKGVRGQLWNYQLRGGSPAIDTGTNTITGYTLPVRDFWGLVAPISSRNIGPHELVS